jgi:predicted CXXCH cytochrome family protein
LRVPSRGIGFASQAALMRTASPMAMGMRRLLLVAVGLLCVETPVLAQRRPATTTSSSITWRAPEAGHAEDYVGSERCRSCHKAEFTEFEKTPHARTTGAPAGAITGCEVCHGPGKAHAEGEEGAHGDDQRMAAAARLIFRFDGTPRENAGRCLTCHTSGRSQQNFAHSEHFMHGVACQDCHSAHLTEAADAAAGAAPLRTRSAQARLFAVPEIGVESAWLQGSLLTRPQPALCFRCHADVQAAFTLPTHHRVPEGLMTCTDCHEPHGTMNPTALRGVRFDACLTCHADKRGPFVFEHASVQVEGCIACHTPHGSVNRMLLTRREGRFLCLECHVTPFAANTPHSRLGFQARGECTRCHVAIHGSNFNADFLQ